MKAGVGALVALVGLAGVFGLDPVTDGFGIYAIFCALPPLGFYVVTHELT